MSQSHDGDVAVAVPYSPEKQKYLVLKRSQSQTSPGLWNFPGGSVEETDISNREAALRELKEETGLTGEIIKSTGDFHWGGNVGNFRIYGFLVEVNSEKIKLNTEHSDYQWIELKELKELDTVGELKVVDQLDLK